MIIANKKYLKKVLPRITKDIEELSNLKADLNNLEIKLINPIFLMLDEKGSLKDRFIESFFKLGSHISYNNTSTKSLEFPQFYYGNLDSLHSTIGHEILHNAQVNMFPEIDLKQDILELKAMFYQEEREKYHSLQLLIEGDARLIENQFIKKYSLNPQLKLPKWIGDKQKKEVSTVYSIGERKLLDEFGGDRDKINRLYTKSIDEIHEIFGSK